MSNYTKAMKHWKNPRKWKHSQPILMDAPSFKGAKSIWADCITCPKCGYERPRLTFNNEICEDCQPKDL
jgi:hypothetical protein